MTISALYQACKLVNLVGTLNDFCITVEKSLRFIKKLLVDNRLMRALNDNPILLRNSNTPFDFIPRVSVFVLYRVADIDLLI